MNRVAVLLLAAGALAVVPSGCGGGGGGGERLSKSEYQQRMQDLGKKLSASFTGLSGVASPGSLKDAADGIEKAADLLDDAAGNFDDIEPPKEIESAHQELVDGAHEAADEFRDLADQIRNGDLNLQQEFDPSKLEGFRRIQRGIDAIKAKGYSIGEAG